MCDNNGDLMSPVTHEAIVRQGARCNNPCTSWLGDGLDQWARSPLGRRNVGELFPVAFPISTHCQVECIWFSSLTTFQVVSPARDISEIQHGRLFCSRVVRLLGASWPERRVLCRSSRQSSVSTTVNTHANYSLATLLKHLARLERQVPCALTCAELLQRGGILTVGNIGAISAGKSAMPCLVAVLCVDRPANCQSPPLWTRTQSTAPPHYSSTSRILDDKYPVCSRAPSSCSAAGYSPWATSVSLARARAQCHCSCPAAALRSSRWVWDIERGKGEWRLVLGVSNVMCCESDYLIYGGCCKHAWARGGLARPARPQSKG